MPTFQERLEDGLLMRKMTPADLSKATQIGEGAISQYRKGAYKASQRNLEKIAKALHVSIPWLMGVTDDPAPSATPAGASPDAGASPPLTEKDKRDIARQLDAMLGQLDAPEGALMFDGEPLDDETRELLRISLQNQLELTKKLAKAKFTPKKYRKD